MIALFELLPESAMDWIVSNSKERRLKKSDILINEGADIDSIFIVLEGVMSVLLPSSGNKLLGLFGPGAVVGEISFVTEEPPSASVVAGEDVLVLALSRVKLLAKIEGDTLFAAQFYRAVAVMVAEKLRKTNARLSVSRPSETESADTQATRRIEAAIGAFKDALNQADQDVLRGGKPLPKTSEKIDAAFRDIMSLSHELLSPESTLPRMLKEQMGSRLQSELLPYIQLCDSIERCYSKPRGYAGDYYTIERFYENQPRGTGRLGAVVDGLFLNFPVARAIRNRRNMLAVDLERAVAAKQGQPLEVLSVACGPARELEDAYSRLPDPKLLHATLLDLDLLALACVEDWRKKRHLEAQITLLNDNLIHLALGKKFVELKPLDLIYSCGLIDYFDDKLVIRLLNFMHTILAPGGRIIIGHFHPTNPCKEIMDYVFEWNLIHRSEEDISKLFKASAFKTPATRVRFEEESMLFFAECVKK